MSGGQRGTRREFVRECVLGAISVGAGLQLPSYVPASALGRTGRPAASERITMGLIGCGGHGTGWNLDRMFDNPLQQVVAVCDVDRSHAARAQQRVDRHYSNAVPGSYKACAVYHDFRELVNRKDIDAIDVATPDHWHVLPALMGVKAAKHVICEKPLTLFVVEGRVLADAVERSGRVFQTASENRSIDSYIRCVELVRNGYIGQLKHMEVTLPAGNERRGVKDEAFLPQPVPEGFDYDMWLGQAPWAPYCPARCHNTFRWNLAYSGGRLTDWGAHLIDLAQWANDTERSGPVEVEGHGKFPPRDAVWNTAYEFDIKYRYANGVTMRVSSSRPGIKFIGSEGWIGFDGWRAPLRASNPKILDAKIPADKQLYRPAYIVKRPAPDGGEHRNFTEAITTGRPTYAPAEIGHRTITIAHIGNISMLLGGRRLSWDPANERFLGDEEANAMLNRKQREPWTMANVDAWINVG